MDRSTEAARQLASRARRRVQAAPRPDTDRAAQRQAVSAFLAAARDGDFGGLLELLAPEVVLHVDAGLGKSVPFEVTGARAVAEEILRTSRRFLPYGIPATVNGAPAVLYGTWEEPLCVLGFTVTDGKISEMHLIGHRARLRRLRLSLTPGPR